MSNQPKAEMALPVDPFNKHATRLSTATKFGKALKVQQMLVLLLMLAGFTKAYGITVGNDGSDKVQSSNYCQLKTPDLTYGTINGACDNNMNTASMGTSSAVISTVYDKTFFVQFPSAVLIRSIRGDIQTSGCTSDVYVTNSKVFTLNDVRTVCKLNVWPNGVFNCDSTLKGTYLAVMPITGEFAAQHQFREIRAWSRKELAGTAYITFGGSNLGKALLGLTSKTEISDYKYQAGQAAVISFGSQIELSTVWISFYSTKTNQAITVSVGNNVPSTSTTPSALEWYSASKTQLVSNEEWYFNFQAKPIQYLLISAGSSTIYYRKIAAFGVDNCSTATSVTTQLVNAYSSIAYTLGTTISIPWPIWTITPTDCFSPVNLIFKFNNVQVAAGIFTQDWVAKTITYTSNTCHSPAISIQAEFSTLNGAINSADLIPITCVVAGCTGSVNSIIPYTLRSPSQFQINYSVTTPVTILSFMMHTDAKGNAMNDNMYCGVKSYSTGLAWLTVLTPADPMTQNFELQVTTNNYTLAGTYSVNLVTEFVGFSLPTLSQTLSVTLLHPCKTTVITTSQTINQIIYEFGAIALEQQFTEFSDTVSTQYSVPGLCALTYSIESSIDATDFGLSIVVTGRNNYIKVLTTNQAQIGQTANLTLSAICTLQLDIPSPAVIFQVTVQDPCPTTIITFSFSSLPAMTNKVTLAAVTQTFALASDSASTNIASLCGPLEYSIVEAYSFLTVTAGNISLASNSMADILNTQIATLQAKLTNQPGVTAATVAFSVTLTNPCLTTTLVLPTTLVNKTINTFSGTAVTQVFAPATDTAATAARVVDLCGIRVYTIVETTPNGFVSIVPPTSNLYTFNQTLSMLSNNLADAGTWTITLQANLQDYTNVAAVTKAFTLTVTNPCVATTINSQTLTTPNDFQLAYTQISAVTIVSFMMNTDTVGVAQSSLMYCGVKSYSTGLAWLTVKVPADPLTQNFELQVTTNDYTLANTYSVNLVVSFANASYISTITQTLSVTLLHPCKTTIITTSYSILDNQYFFGATALQQLFTQFSDTASTQYSVSGLCALTYSIASSTDATDFGVSIVVTGPNYYIQVMTTNQAKIGQTANFTLSANGTPQQDTQSSTVTFSVTVSDPCHDTVISFSFSSLTAMTNNVTLAAVSQTFNLASDSVSTTLGIASLCGPIEYSILEAYSFITVTAGNISLASNAMTDINTYALTLQAKLINYSRVAAATVAFSVTLTNPCLTTTLILSTTFTDQTITSNSGTAVIQVFAPATNTAATDANVVNLCGVTVYTIVGTTPNGVITIVAPAPNLNTLDWTLSMMSNNVAHAGTWTVTLQATLQDYTGVAAATKAFTLTVILPCVGTTINSQTLTAPSPFQLAYTQTSAVTIVSFMMNTDTIGVTQSSPMLCGVKSYSTGLAWLTVKVPADPLTQNFELQVATNEYTLANTYTVNLVVSFSNSSYTSTITQTLSVTLLHPCKTTVITTSQSILAISYVFGATALQQQFTEFSDSVSTQYSVPGLCALAYSLASSTDATNFGVSIVLTGSNYQIKVLTTNQANIGQTANLTLSANGMPQQDTPSSTVAFSVQVQDPCISTVISFSFSSLQAMTNTVTLAAVSQTFVLAADSKSTATGVTTLCGPMEYDIVEGYSFLTLTTGNISLVSNSMTHINTYTATLRAKLTNYAGVTAATVSFSVTLTNPCLMTTLAFPTTLVNKTITSYSGTAVTQVFAPATDTAAIAANLVDLCGIRLYTIVETTPNGVVTIVAPATNLNTLNWTLSMMSNNVAHAGTWTVTLQATLQDYTGVAAATKAFTLTVILPCVGTTINSQTLTDPSSFQLAYTQTSAVTIVSFMMNTDTIGVTQSLPMLCGVKSYSTGLAWLTVKEPADPLTQNFELQVTTNDYTLASTHSVNLVVSFSNSSYTSTITQTLSVTLLHPCKITVITTSQSILAISYVFGATAFQQQFTEFSDSVSTQYSVPGLCALTYSITSSTDATNFGVSIVVTGINYYIQVLTTNQASLGQTSNLTLSANAASQQNTPGQTVTFSVTVQDPCPATVISFGFSSLPAMTNTVTLAPVSQTFALASDSVSITYGISSLCGPIEYSIVEPYSFLTVTAGNISLASNSISNVNTYTATLNVKLTNYSTVTAATVAFSVTLTNPCLTTTLELPTTLISQTINSFIGTAVTLVFAPATDKAATFASISELCGPRVYSIVETIPQGFVSIVAPSTNEYRSNWSLSMRSNNLAHVGTWTVTLQAKLQDYTGVAAVTQAFTLTVINLCIGTKIQSQVLTAPKPFQITFPSPSAVSILSFMMNTDTVGAEQSSPMICGVKSFSTGLAWLTVLAPTDPLTQNFELQVTTNDYTLTGTYAINLVVSFANSSYTSTLTQTLSVKLLHPCTVTVINAPTIPVMTFFMGDAKKLTEFAQMTDSVAFQYNIQKFCGERKYELPDNLPFLSFVQPEDPWQQTTKIVLVTSDQTKIGQYSVNLKASLVSYADVSTTILIPVMIKAKSVNKLPYFYPTLINSAQIQMTTESQSWSMSLPKILDPDAADVVTLTADFGIAANFLKLNGIASIGIDDIKKDGSSNIRSGIFPITFTLDDTKTLVKVQFRLFVIDPPAVDYPLPLATATPPPEAPLSQPENQIISETTKTEISATINTEISATTNFRTTQIDKVNVGTFDFDPTQWVLVKKSNINSTSWDGQSKRKEMSFAIKSISYKGEITIQFSEPIVVPWKYKKILSNVTASNVTASNVTTSNSFTLRDLSEKQDQAIIVHILPGRQSNIQNLTYSWKIHEFTEKDMKVLVSFDNAQFVSTHYDLDSVAVVIKDVDQFVSKSGATMDQQLLIKQLPRQMELGSTESKVANAATSASTGVQTFVIGNILMSIVLSASLNQLFSMVEAQQLVCIITCSQITLPPLPAVFISKFFQIANFDILQGGLVYGKIFYMPTGNALNANFDAVGFKDMYVVNNMGTLLITLFGVIALQVIMVFLLQQKKKSLNFHYKIHIWEPICFWNLPIKVVLEGYASLVVASLMTAKSHSFQTTGQKIDTVMGITGLILASVFPVIVLFLMVKHQNQFQTPKIIKKYGSLYEGLTTENKWIIAHRLWFIIRRIILALNVIFVKDLMIQIVIWFVQQLISLVIIAHGEPFESKPDYVGSILNEVFIQFTIYHVMLFSSFIDSISVQNTLGYWFCGMLFFHLIANITVIAIVTVKQKLQDFKRWRIIRREMARTKKIMEERKQKPKHDYSKRRRIFMDEAEKQEFNWDGGQIQQRNELVSDQNYNQEPDLEVGNRNRSSMVKKKVKINRKTKQPKLQPLLGTINEEDSCESSQSNRSAHKEDCDGESSLQLNSSVDNQDCENDEIIAQLCDNSSSIPSMEEEEKEEESMESLSDPENEEKKVHIEPIQKSLHDYSDDHPYKETWKDLKGVNNIELFEVKEFVPFGSKEFDDFSIVLCELPNNDYTSVVSRNQAQQPSFGALIDSFEQDHGFPCSNPVQLPQDVEWKQMDETAQEELIPDVPDVNFDPLIELDNVTSSFYDKSKDNRHKTSIISLVDISLEEDITQNQALTSTAPVDFHHRLSPGSKKLKQNTSRQQQLTRAMKEKLGAYLQHLPPKLKRPEMILLKQPEMLQIQSQSKKLEQFLSIQDKKVSEMVINRKGNAGDQIEGTKLDLARYEKSEARYNNSEARYESTKKLEDGSFSDYVSVLPKSRDQTKVHDLNAMIQSLNANKQKEFS